MDKAALRTELRSQRRALGAADLTRAGTEAAAHLTAWEGWRAARTVALHVGVRGELPTDSVIAAALAAGKTVFLPASGMDGLELRALISADLLAPGAHGIPEPPADAARADLATLDLVLAPGVAFDRKGNRLGQGGGDYDRLLAALPARTATVGWCHPFQVIERVPMEPHDRRVGWLATTTGLIRTGC